MTMRIGINPLAWTHEYLPELGGDTSVETCLSEARQAGYEGIEIGAKFPQQAAPLRALVARHNLTVVSGWYCSRVLERNIDAEKRSLEGHLALLAELGCKLLVCAEVTGAVHMERDRPLHERPTLSTHAWRALGARLNALAQHTAQFGLKLAYHHHMGTLVQTADDIDRLVLHTSDAVGLVLDTGNLVYAGGDPVALVQRHADRLVHVHCKDVRPHRLRSLQSGAVSFPQAILEGVFTVPGDGGIDYRTLVAALKRHDYRGWLIVEGEQDPKVAPPLIYATYGFAHLKQLVDEIPYANSNTANHPAPHQRRAGARQQ